MRDEPSIKTMINCPDCESEVTEERNQLTEEEWTTILSCTNCEFEIETESNLVYEERMERMREETRVSI